MIRHPYFSGLIVAMVSIQMHAAEVRADCLYLVKGPISLQVESCTQVNPESFQQPLLKNMDPWGRQQLLDSYRGLKVSGKVVRSEAIKEGESTKKGVLAGESAAMFIPFRSDLTCDALQTKKIAGRVAQNCCDGGTDSPCLIQTEYILNDVTLVATEKVKIEKKKMSKKPIVKTSP